ncbi:MAG: hypothetical protein H6737_12475 [Alphaproteobacteria bacterium]|nr:hypothetical protein [Alphaproteobacteria bacterium]
MRFAMNDIQRIYRNANSGSPCDAIRVSHRLGAVWYAGRERVLPPEPSLASLPWVQIGVVPATATDGIEDRLVVCDAELARHALAWRIEAPENQDNVFVRLAVGLGLVERVEGAFGPDTAVFLTGVVRNPLSKPSLEVRGVMVGAESLGGHVRDGALEALGLT